MADDTLDDDLLALAGDDDDSASEQEEIEPHRETKKSPSPVQGKSTADFTSQKEPSIKSDTDTSSSGPKRKLESKVPKVGGSVKRIRKDSEENGQPSAMDSPDNSLGSGAMSESESDAALPSMENRNIDDDRPFPVEGKFKSLQDKAYIMSMPEANREQILSERIEEMEKSNFSRALKQRLQTHQTADAKSSKKRKDHPDAESSPRKLTRQKTKATENLEAYKRQREQRNEQRRNNDNRRTKDKLSPVNGHEGSDPDADDDNDVDWDEKPHKTSPPHAEPPLDIRHIERIRFGRSHFAKHCYTPGFESAIKGCFVRIGVEVLTPTEMRYRIAIVKDIITGKPYIMEGANKQPIQTDQYMVVAYGKFEKAMALPCASDGSFTRHEFEAWKEFMVEVSLNPPRVSFLERKEQELQALVDHKWTDAEITAKLRRSGVEKFRNITINRNRLNAERVQAVTNNNEAEIARIDKELELLNNVEAFNAKMNGVPSNGNTEVQESQQDRLAAVNARNRQENFEEIKKALTAERKAARKAQLAVERGEGVANPFARIKTRPKIIHDFEGDSHLSVPKSKAIDDLFEGSDRSRTGTPEPKSKSNGTPKPKKELKQTGTFAKRKTDDDYLAEMDFGIDIDI